MKINIIKELKKYGQSLWLDNIRRALITSGELKELINEGLTGVTSNPTIFEKAIAGSRDYDKQMLLLITEGKGVTETLNALTIKDIQMAADLFLPVFEETDGQDGFVSIEVNPALAYKTDETIRAVKEIHQRVKRNNVMIKVPATPEGVRAIEELTAEGFSINVTLIFSVERYEEVAKAYIAGLKRRIKKGLSLGPVQSVASVFVSRIDTVVDKLLEGRIHASKDAEEEEELKSLLGKVALSNAKLIYQRFKAFFEGQEFLELQKHGAHPQRPLWASTGTKNSNYTDLLYVVELIGPDTVNTVPPATLIAFRDHGRVRPSLEEDLEGARKTIEKIGELGINLKRVMHELQEQGVHAFVKSFTKLTACISAKRVVILSGNEERFLASLGRYEEPINRAIQSLDQNHFSERLWAMDATLWKTDPEIQKKIKNRLGWLTVTGAMTDQAGEIMEFARLVRDAGFTHVVLLGMGGSSLCPEVFRMSFGVAKGYPDLIVLDTTDPVTILNVEKSIDLTKTLFIVASKSGTTIEVESLYCYFYEKLKAIKLDLTGDHFIAITDPWTPLEGLARTENFRRIFLASQDIGGRYSALSYFGLVPAALIGIDLNAFLDRAEEMVYASASCIPAEENPGIRLGAILGELGTEGRDKVTMICSSKIGSFGYWLEQLIAESTGKEGKGLVPVVGEKIGEPEVYGDDRLFIYLKTDSSPDKDLDRKVMELQSAGHPVVTIRLRDTFDLAKEFFRWEIATSAAGSILGINPFDEPNVSESKENTRKILEEFQATGKLPLRREILEEEGIRLYGDPRTVPDGSIKMTFETFLNQARPNDYLALMAYIEPSRAHEALLQKLRHCIRDRYCIATSLGYGPRFLHSTGQLHKGGAGNGLFLQITADDQEDIQIPGETYTFGSLKSAQALGDFYSLTGRGLRVLQIRLGSHVEKDLKKLIQLIGISQKKIGGDLWNSDS